MASTSLTNQNVECHILTLFEKLEAMRRDAAVSSSRLPMQVEVRTLEFWRSIISECLATFFYVFIACGGGASLAGPGASQNLGAALATGFAVATLTQCFGHVSGAHMNPAVTVAMATTRNISPLRAAMFVTAQCGGGIAGAALLYGVTLPGYPGVAGSTSSVASGSSNPALLLQQLASPPSPAHLTAWERFGVDFILSFIVVFTYFVCMADCNGGCGGGGGASWGGGSSWWGGGFSAHRRWLQGQAALPIGAAYLSCSLVAMNEIQALELIRERRRRELRLINRTRLRRLRDLSDPYLMPGAAFQGLYRLNKALTRELITELEPHMNQAERSTAIPVKLKVLCALHFFGQGSYQKSAGSDCHLGLSQAAVSRAIEEVTEALNTPEVLTRWIYFPMTRNERRQTIQENYQATGFPGVLGFVDGTHVAIRAPAERENLYANRKSYHSINAQIVCDSKLQILNCVARYPGSTHDSFIWSNSEVFRGMRTLWESGERCWLLGDSGYPHQPWLQTPILDAAEGSPEENYTNLHVRARSAVERCIGVLKSRFRCLHRTLEYAPAKVGRIINACSILHNMCVGHGLFIPEEEEDGGQIPNMPPEPFLAHRRALLREARTVRESIVHRLQR